MEVEREKRTFEQIVIEDWTVNEEDCLSFL